MASTPIEAETFRARVDGLAAWLISAGLAALVAAFHIRHSLDGGALALPPTYDDVGYFIDAAARLDTLRRGGLEAFFAEYAARPPHSPLASLLALIGFSFFGVKPWAACAATAIPLALLVRAFFAIARDVPLWMTALAALALLGSPLVGIVIIEFRPDAIGGLVTACGLLFIVLRRWARGATATTLAAGGFLALALWAKPSVFALTIVLFGAAMAAASVPDIWRRASRRNVLRAWALTIGTAAVLAAPHYVFAFDATVGYFVENMFGQHSDIWNMKAPPLEHMLYYLVGIGGRFTLGAWLYLALLAAAICVAVILRRRDRAAFGQFLRGFAVILICYVAISATAHKSPFIGISLTALTMVGVAIGVAFALRHLARSGRTMAASAVAIALLAFSLAEFRTPWAGHGAPPVSAAEAAAKRRMLVETADTLQAMVPEGATILNTAIGAYLNPSTLMFESLQRHGARVRPIDLHRHGDAGDYRAALPRADLAIAFAPDAEVIPWLPSAGLRKQFLDDLRSDPDWLPVQTIEDRQGVGPVYVFRRVPVLGETFEVKGFGPIEGPYPQWSLPKVRWGRGPQSAIVAAGPANAKARLVIEVRAPMEGQAMTLALDGKALGALPAPSGAAFQRHEVEFAYPASGKATIVIAYAKNAERAVLFKTLRIVPIKPD